jgi:hypothetical protein
MPGMQQLLRLKIRKLNLRFELLPYQSFQFRTGMQEILPTITAFLEVCVPLNFPFLPQSGISALELILIPNVMDS